MPATSSTPIAADRNLLFGIQALQMNFINRDGLIAAMNAWVMDKAKPLGQILGEQGALQPADRDLLEAVIKRHLQIHDGDVQRSLASLSSVESLREDLQQVADPDVNASLAYVPGGTTPHYNPCDSRPSAVGQPSVPGLRFRILQEHAKGGLGAVFLAEDKELHRQVALKELQEKYAHQAESQSRFLLEAEVTGGLEHPGIVPVYGLGRYPDGRPYYAMRFIKGDSFHEAIRRFYVADQQQRDPGERSLAFRELLGQFVDACNALAYAHARGILHRDVKPHNIMLGKYGETLVVDWGLAKVIGHREGQPEWEEVTLLPSTSGDLAPTQSGHVMGTPAYMSPEQADGQLDLLGPASDIYSLGATLYELLTGQKPIQGSSLGEIIFKAKRGDWLPPRKVRKDVPAALDAICRKALALRPRERYASASELAVDIEHWLADEPVTAYREPWTRRLRRWVRRHRGLAAGTAGLLVTAALAASLVAVDHHKQRVKLATQEEALARTRNSLGIQLAATGQSQDAEEAYREALDRQKQLAADFPAVPLYRMELSEIGNNLGTLLASTGKAREAEGAYRDALDLLKQLVANFPDVTGYRMELAASHNNLGNLLQKTGRPGEAERAYRDALTLQKQLAAEFPAEPGYRKEQAISLNNLGNLLQNKGRPNEAEGVYRDALAFYEQLAAEFPDSRRYRQELAVSQNNLGKLLQETSRPGEAERAYRAALALLKQLAADFPALRGYRQELAVSQSNLGYLLQQTGRSQEAEGPMRYALALLKQLAAEFPAVPRYRQELATSHNNLGIFFKDMNRPKEAEGAYRDALALQKQLATEFPDVPDYRRDLARSHNNLGALLAERVRLKEAEGPYRDAFTLQKQLAAEFPNVPDYRNELANTMVNLAELLRDRKDFTEARKLLESARPHHEAAMKANPQNPNYRTFFRNNGVILASTLAGLGDHVGAGQTAEQLAALGRDPAQDAYAAACALAQCVAVTEKDAKLPEAKRQALVRSYADRALAMLRQGISKGYKDAAHMTKDPYLEPLRSQPEFEKLLKELEAKAKAEGK